MQKIKKSTKEYGDLGEKIAADFLKKQGYRIIEKNYRQKCAEIDIIAEKNGVIYFVEVKARHDSTFIRPSANVNAAKRRHIAAAATIWLSANGDHETSLLVAEVDLSTQKVELIEDFFI